MLPMLPNICNNYSIRLPTFHLPLIKHAFAEQRLDYQLIKMLTIKFVGIIVDNKLKWHEHIIYIKNKVSRAIGIIYKVIVYFILFSRNMPISKLPKNVLHICFSISHLLL